MCWPAHPSIENYIVDIFLTEDREIEFLLKNGETLSGRNVARNDIKESEFTISFYLK